MANSKKYWQGFEDLMDSPLAQKFKQNEFAQEIPTDEFLGNEQALGNSQTTRRDFLKYLGFSTAAATLAACEAPIVESIPYVVKPDTIVPGVPTYYASTMWDGYDYAPVLVKTREGRPIKLEPNDMASFNAGTNARVQASVLGLYDGTRLRNPIIEGAEASWDDAINKLISSLSNGEKAILLTSTIISPSTKSIIERLVEKYSNLQHVVYDSVSVSQKLDLYERMLGERAMPLYRFNDTKLVVSLASDFLGDWNGQNVAADYAIARKPGPGMLRHIQLESNLSLTGSNADKRIKLKPSEYGSAIVYLTNKIAIGTNHAGNYAGGDLSSELKQQLDGVAAELIANQGKSIFIAGGNDVNLERFAVAINLMLDNINTTIDIADLVYLRQGSDNAVLETIKAINAGSIKTVITFGVNPVYSLPSFSLEKVKNTFAFAERLDETAIASQVVMPVHHYLESWGDLHPKRKTYALTQPTIRPLFNTMQMEDVMLMAIGEKTSYSDYLKAFYAEKVQSKTGLSWSEALQNGVVEKEPSDLDYFVSSIELVNIENFKLQVIEALVESSNAIRNTKAGEYQIVFYQKAGIGNGNQVNNPWLQELPDPVSRISWDNYLTISASDALTLGLKNENQSDGALNGSLVNLTIGETKLENVPVFIQPGQTQGTVGLAVGYGRTDAGRAADGLGVNAYTLMGDMAHWNTDVKIENADGMHGFASVQLGHTMMGRKIVNEVNLDDYINGDPHDWNHKHQFASYKGPLTASEANLWDDHDHETLHMWNMSIDLNACIGCGACVVACHLENNVPVVGKEEVRKHRDMHWLRIDRYYSSDMTKEVAEAEGIGGRTMYKQMEEASENPEVVFQPVMCQHCNHAPCETVCPVAATTHSREGLNHMAYNRCIGTRYCANNCPYKVRRFNWFNYKANSKFSDVNPAQDDYGRMVLNPDVTVRSRGVMEKCTMCIQRIQYAKLEAKKSSGKLKDGMMVTACAQACPSGAITVGDVNDEQSKISALKNDKRAYHLLEEVGTQPSVFYQTKVRNKA